MRLSVIELPVLDIERAKRFWGTALGLPLSVETGPASPEGSALYNFANGPGLQLRVVTMYADHHRTQALVVIEVGAGNNVAKLLRHIEQAGGTIASRKSTGQDWLSVLAYDPDGNGLELLIPR